MKACSGAVFILLILPLLSQCASESNEPADVKIYTYKSALSFLKNPAISRKLDGFVLVKEHSLNGIHVGKLLQIVVGLGGTSGPLQCLALRDETGLIDSLLIPPLSSSNSSDLRQNFLKAIISLFNYRYSFEPSIEYDASGRCQTNYSDVSNIDIKNTEPENFRVIEKEKRLCEPIVEPLDAGSWSVSPVLQEQHAAHHFLRYFFNPKSGELIRVKAFEQHNLSVNLGSTYSELDAHVVIGEQTLELIQEVSLKQTIMSEMSVALQNLSREQLSNIFSGVLGAKYQTHHLALSLPPNPASQACGIQSTVLPTEHLSNLCSELTPARLQRILKAFQSDLESDAYARISSVHASLQLTRFLRCLPSSIQMAQAAIDALNFVPTSRLHLLKESGTWRDQLTDVVINCGTELCLDLIRQRLIKLNELSELHLLGSSVSRDTRKVRSHLLGILWPAVGHISNPTLSIFDEIATICLESMPKLIKSSENGDFDVDNPYTCLLTISVLSSTVSSRNPNTDESSTALRISSYIDSLLEDEENHVSTSNNKPLDQFHRQKLLAVLSAAEKLKSHLLVSRILSISANPRFDAIFKFIALKTLHDYHFVLPQHQQIFSEIATKMMNIVESSGNYLNSIDDEILLKFGAFSVLMHLRASPPILATVLANFGRQHLWSLVESCRSVVSNMCMRKMLSDNACSCILFGGVYRHLNKDSINTYSATCNPGLAAGWSGLAVSNASGVIHYISDILLNSLPAFLSDFSLYWITGIDGSFRTSNLAVSLTSEGGKTKMLEFNVIADHLSALTGGSESAGNVMHPWLSVGFSFLRGSIPPHQFFSGGLMDILNLAYYAPASPTVFFKNFRLPIDIRRYIPLSLGWVLRNDVLGASSVEISAALTSNLWSQSGKSLIRTRTAVVMENLLTPVLSMHSFQGRSCSASTQIAVNGFGSAARLDFVTKVEIAGLPDSLCMSFQLARMTPVQRWIGTYNEMADLGQRINSNHPLPKSPNVKNENFEITMSTKIPPITYNLGSENSKKCQTMGGSTDW